MHNSAMSFDPKNPPGDGGERQHGLAALSSSWSSTSFSSTSSSSSSSSSSKTSSFLPLAVAAAQPLSSLSADSNDTTVFISLERLHDQDALHGYAGVLGNVSSAWGALRTNSTTTSLGDNDTTFLNDSDAEEKFYPLLKQPLHMVVVYALAYSLVGVAAIVGNLMVMAVVARKPTMHSVTHYFLFNLACADLLVALICVPVNLVTNLFNGWQLGPLMCKTVPYLQGVAVCASVLTLAAIALDRYLAICHALGMKISKRKCKIILFFIWLVALNVMVPWLIFYTHELYVSSRQNDMYICYDAWPSTQVHIGYYVGVLFVCCYSLPLAMITICYGLIGLKVWRRQGLGAENSSTKLIQRSKVKVIKMLMVVCVLFTLSWLPLYVLNFWRAIQPDMPAVLNQIATPLAQWLSSSNCCMNPIIYCFFSKKFREGFHELVTCCAARRGRRGRWRFCCGPYGRCFGLAGRDSEGINGAGSGLGDVSGSSRVRFLRGHSDYAATRTVIIRNGSTRADTGNDTIVSL